MRTLIALFSALALVLIAACGGGGTTEAEEPACDIDLTKLTGDFVVKRAHPEFGDHIDKDFRVHFRQEDGKSVAYATRGRFNPSNQIDPTTLKHKYVLKNIKDKDGAPYEALYVQDMLADLPEERKADIEKLKQQDFMKDPNRIIFEFRLYVKPQMDKCRLTISDYYFTWSKGKEMEDSNPGGTQKYVKWEGKELNMYSCPQMGSLAAKQGEEEIKPAGAVDGVKPVDFMAESEAKEGCTYEAKVFIRDELTDIAPKVESAEGKVTWSFSTPVAYREKPDWGSKHHLSAMVELVRWQTCAGKKEPIDALCTVVIPNAP